MTQIIHKSNRTPGWVCMADKKPTPGITFVMTSTKWKARQYVVKSVWSETENRNNKTELHCLYWYPLPVFNGDLHHEN